MSRQLICVVNRQFRLNKRFMLKHNRPHYCLLLYAFTCIYSNLMRSFQFKTVYYNDNGSNEYIELDTATGVGVRLDSNVDVRTSAHPSGSDLHVRQLNLCLLRLLRTPCLHDPCGRCVCMTTNSRAWSDGSVKTTNIK